ncbi:MAG: DciA family protein [Desulfurella sp.]|uniref:DciA family protein n=1 Tax=Desulfurella sp. TaxID=1962857 RepID=UPI003C84076E
MALVDISTATFDVLKELGLGKAVDMLKAQDAFKQLNFDSRDVVILNYESGILTIGVFNSVWHQEMESIKNALIEKLNVLSTDIKFKRIIIKEIAYDWCNT